MFTLIASNTTDMDMHSSGVGVRASITARLGLQVGADSHSTDAAAAAWNSAPGWILSLLDTVEYR